MLETDPSIKEFVPPSRRTTIKKSVTFGNGVGCSERTIALSELRAMTDGSDFTHIRASCDYNEFDGHTTIIELEVHVPESDATYVARCAVAKATHLRYYQARMESEKQMSARVRDAEHQTYLKVKARIEAETKGNSDV